MSLEDTDIKNVAWLARLALDDDKIPEYQREMATILEMVEQMNTVDTSTVVPLAHPLEISARLRTDEVTETNQRDRFQKIAPDVQDGLYRVPRVIE